MNKIIEIVREFWLSTLFPKATLSKIVPGMYVHFKRTDKHEGTVEYIYEVLSISEDTESGELRVVYRPAYRVPERSMSLNRTHFNFTQWVRRNGEPRVRFVPVRDPALIALAQQSITELYGNK